MRTQEESRPRRMRPQPQLRKRQLCGGVSCRPLLEGVDAGERPSLPPCVVLHVAAQQEEPFTSRRSVLGGTHLITVPTAQKKRSGDEIKLNENKMLVIFIETKNQEE